jgi:hypothetical protein
VTPAESRVAAIAPVPQPAPSATPESSQPPIQQRQAAPVNDFGGS